MINLQSNDFLGITGVIGSGKSFLAQNFSIYENEIYINSTNSPISVFEIDDIRRELLWNSQSNLAIQLRKKLTKFFNIKNYNSEYFFDRIEFTNFIFSSKDILNEFNTVCKPFFIHYIHQNQLKNHINLIVWVNLIEDYYHLNFPFKHIIHTTISNKKWNKHNSSILSHRIKLQNNPYKKNKILKTSGIPYSIIYYE